MVLDHPALVLALGFAVVFALSNGFHNAAAATATLVATRAARPVTAMALTTACSLIGPLVLGGAVATTIARVVNVPPERGVAVIGAALTGAALWNLFTWRLALPSSSGHALVGGLVGSTLLDSGPNALTWGPVTNGHLGGVIGILAGLLLAAAFGLAVAFVFERLAMRLMRRATRRVVNPIRRLQFVTSASLALTLGANDAQKTVGVMALLLFDAGRSTSLDVSPLLILAAAGALSTGMLLGGWALMRTMGRGIFPLRSLDGLVSQGSSAGVLLAASLTGAPVSTTQVVASSLVGIGLGRRRWRHVGWRVVQRIGVAWLTTPLAAAIIAALALPLWRLLPGG
jgi:PiT family inorganic phosphate transporter